MVKMELVKDSTPDSTIANIAWYGQPVPFNRKKRIINYYRLNFPTDSISVNARNSLRIFANDARALFNKHNRGIKDNLFYKKKVAESFGDLKIISIFAPR